VLYLEKDERYARACLKIDLCQSYITNEVCE